MLVREQMSKPVIRICPEMTTHEALDLMCNKEIHHLPVVDRQDHLIGIVSESDLLYDSPSDVAGLVAWEINYFRNKIHIDEVMTREVLTVNKEATLDEAAIIMTDNNVKCLPVVHDNKVVGIITNTDLVQDYPELLGAREQGIHVDVLITNHPDELATLIKTISDSGGSIIALEAFDGNGLEDKEICIKVAGVGIRNLERLIEPLVKRIIDIHESRLPQIETR